MNFNIPITNNISDSYSSSGEEESFIKYTTKKRKRCINYIDNDRCNKVIPIIIVIVIFVENVIGLIKKI